MDRPPYDYDRGPVRLNRPAAHARYREPVFVALTEDLSAGSHAEATIYVGDPAGENDPTATGGTLKVYDFFLGTGESLSSGTKCKAEWFAAYGRWYITAAEC